MSADLTGDALPPDLAGLDAALTTHTLGRRVVFLRETDSTMRTARDAAAAGCESGLVVAADHQSAGRGRQGRVWDDAPGASILASLVVRLPASVPPTRAVLALAVGVADALAGLGVAARLKWPNDVRIGGRKVAGILAMGLPPTADRGGAGQGTAVVLGLGLNVGAASVPPDLGDVATSLGAECRAAGMAVPSRGAVLAAVLSATEPLLDRAADARALVARYGAHLEGLGETIALDTGAGIVTGVFAGVDDDGALRLRSPDGVVRRHHAGDVHITSFARRKALMP